MNIRQYEQYFNFEGEFKSQAIQIPLYLITLISSC